MQKLGHKKVKGEDEQNANKNAEKHEQKCKITQEITIWQSYSLNNP